MKIAVSACLLGERCRYDGVSKCCEAVVALGKDYQLIAVCPEQLGGLPTPRVPAEIIGERVITKNGADVTEAYQQGARESLRIAQGQLCDVAVLKSRSPSCGKGCIYDGTFTGTLIAGDGVTAQLFKRSGLRVLTEEDIASGTDPSV